jgi:hypothetical protein
VVRPGNPPHPLLLGPTCVLRASLSKWLGAVLVCACACMPFCMSVCMRVSVQLLSLGLAPLGGALAASKASDAGLSQLSEKWSNLLPPQSLQPLFQVS